MGNRELLLAAARASLVEQGFGASTVREIAARAGVNHAAIGYHFGSRDALLVQALLLAMDDLDREVTAAAGEEEPPWSALLASLQTHRDLWIAQLEAVLQAARDPDVRARLIEGQQRARDGMGGAIPLAVLVGLAVQHLVDPETAVTADDVRHALE